jgi:Flp pilus assembly pilin Flp
MNPLTTVDYLRLCVEVRLDRIRNEDRGASAIEWAIITGLLAIIAITIGGIILTVIRNRANTIRTDNGTVG